MLYAKEISLTCITLGHASLLWYTRTVSQSMLLAKDISLTYVLKECFTIVITTLFYTPWNGSLFKGIENNAGSWTSFGPFRKQSVFRCQLFSCCYNQKLTMSCKFSSSFSWVHVWCRHRFEKLEWLDCVRQTCLICFVLACAFALWGCHNSHVSPVCSYSFSFFFFPLRLSHKHRLASKSALCYGVMHQR